MLKGFTEIEWSAVWLSQMPVRRQCNCHRVTATDEKDRTSSQTTRASHGEIKLDARSITVMRDHISKLDLIQSQLTGISDEILFAKRILPAAYFQLQSWSARVHQSMPIGWPSGGCCAGVMFAFFGSS